MTILITGGAGYIGSITADVLLAHRHSVVIADNLSVGHQETLTTLRKRNPKTAISWLIGDLLDVSFVRYLFSQYRFDGIVHLASTALVVESMVKPAIYLRDNACIIMNILEELKDKPIPVIFSSSCSVYGSPEKLPVTENALLNPRSPYAEGKCIIERILFWYGEIFDIPHIIFRYFNAAGATEDGVLGEYHVNETHLIPLAIASARLNKPFIIHGADYSTIDGTCIRDFIHVVDLAYLHMHALNALQKRKLFGIFNVGSNKPHSVKQVVTAVQEIAGKKFPVVIGARRKGDPAAVWTDNRKLSKTFNWKPAYSDLPTIIKSAHRYYQLRRRN